ncbi:MAG: lytic transglycosylase domain-containing protein [Rhodocyclaceae bacterium]|nr:lytic transglycosylase domain-containing protein [Rhodocyclaceae bacterium]
MPAIPRPVLRFAVRMVAVSALVAGEAGAQDRVAVRDGPPAWSDEPPVVARLLEDGYRAESLRLSQLAASRYCAASRYGSIEGHYRLGRLYLLRGGGSRNRDAGRALLGIAAQGGHEKARHLLGNAQAVVHDLPDCMFGGSLPELALLDEVVPHEVVARFVRNLAPDKRRHAQLVQRLALRYRIDPRLALAIVRAESGFDPLARSPRNAQGLMQLIPETAERFGVRNVLDPEQNVRGGLAYLRWLLDLYGGDVMLASAAYNAGEGAVARYGGVPPYGETLEYVRRILAFYRTSRHQAPGEQG